MLRLLIFSGLILLTNTASTPNISISSNDCQDLSYIYSINKFLPETEEKCLITEFAPFKTVNSDESSKRLSSMAKELAKSIERERENSQIIFKKRIKTGRTSRRSEKLSSSLEENEKIDFKKDSGINMDIVESLQTALELCPNKEATITSGRRHSGYKRSLHRCGKAVDIHYDIDFIDWLISDSGQSWLISHNLEFFIEDNSRKSKKRIPERFQNLFRWIPWATNLHVHLNIKR